MNPGDGAGGQTIVLVRVVRGIYVKVRLEDTVGLIVKAEGNGRVCLELHSGFEPIEIYGCDCRLLRHITGFSVNYRRQGRRLSAGKALLAGGVKALRGPPGIGLLEKLLHNITHRRSPKDLVRVRDYLREKEGRLKAKGIGR